jgi:ketosteroid isomerase-like protein
MSTQRNVQVVRNSFEAFAGGDFETAFAAHDPNTEWRTADDEPDAQTYKGIAGLRRFVGSLAELWLDRFEHTQRFEDFIDCGDWVVVPWSGRLRGRGSGIEVEASETYAIRVRDGRIVRVEEYRTKEEALEAVRRRG